MLALRRLRMYPEKLGNSTITASGPRAEAEGAVVWLQYLLEQINYRGIFSAEFKYDPRDGIFKLIEINARPWWYVDFAHYCGVDVCTMAYRDALGLPVTPVLSYQIGRCCVFPVNDLRAWVEEYRRGDADGMLLLQTWLRSDSTPFHWNDPAPAMQHMFGSLMSLMRSSLASFRHSDNVPGQSPVLPQHRSDCEIILPAKLRL